MKLEPHNYLELLALLTGILTFTRLRSLQSRAILLFLFVTVMVELSSLYITTQVIMKNSTRIYNFYIYFLVVFFMFYLYRSFKGIGYKRAGLVFFWAFTVFYLLNILFWQQLDQFNYFSYLAGSVLLIILACLYLFELLEAADEGILANESFWVTSGILFFFTGTFVYFLCWYFLVDQAADKNGQLFRVLIQVINVIFYLLLSISFICQAGKKK